MNIGFAVKTNMKSGKSGASQTGPGVCFASADCTGKELGDLPDYHNCTGKSWCPLLGKGNTAVQNRRCKRNEERKKVCLRK